MENAIRIVAGVILVGIVGVTLYVMWLLRSYLLRWPVWLFALLFIAFMVWVAVDNTPIPEDFQCLAPPC